MTTKRTTHSFSLLLLALAATALTATAPAQSATKSKLGPPINLNGGFENGKNFYFLTKPKLATIDHKVFAQGKSSLCLKGEGAKSGPANIAVQGYDIPTPVTGKRYVMRIAVKAKNVNPGFPPMFQFRIEDAKRKVTLIDLDKTTIRKDTNWKTFQVTSGPLPAGAKKVAFWLYQPPQSKATVWFDAIEVRQLQK